MEMPPGSHGASGVSTIAVGARGKNQSKEMILAPARRRGDTHETPATATRLVRAFRAYGRQRRYGSRTGDGRSLW
jgi:hypothetical protein